MTVPSWKYGNPLNVMLRAENRTCKGCIHEDLMYIAGKKVNFCARGKTHSDQAGNRCKLYQEKE